MLESLGSKVHDEGRQGEAYQPAVAAGREFRKRFYIESYGCQMNFADSEIVAAILNDNGFGATGNYAEADLILLNTCSIREKAEQTVRNRLHLFRQVKESRPGMLIGVLGCMAERLESKFLEEEKLVDMVVGPDAYRTLPGLVAEAETGQKAVNVLLSREETYADISPVRLDSNGVTAFVSIMRGCNNMCSFCVVPFTRGRERSRSPETIVNEAKDLFEKGYREVTLLGQNVDSYLWSGGGLKKEILTEEQKAGSTNFAQLLEKVALVHPDLRVRFSTSHPKDMNDEVLHTMAKHENICKYVHLPVQSGSSKVLNRMNRGYDREWYIGRMDAIKRIIPDCGISTDVITGFCGETEEEYKETLSLMELIKYDFAYMFFYSERPKTLAERKYEDDIPEEIKKRRLAEVIDMQRTHSAYRISQMVGKTYKVLVEGISKKSNERMMGRNSQNAVVVFPKYRGKMQDARDKSQATGYKTEDMYKKGEYVNVLITECTSTTLIGTVID